VYVETDFLVALVRDDDWLHDAAVAALDEHADEDIHTSILSYAELLVLFYERDQAGYTIDAPRAIGNLLELVPVEPTSHEDALLAAATFIDDEDLTPFDALHAGLVAAGDGRVLSSETDYDAVGLDRTVLAPASDDD
jgi:predicted nucleic acid-binding protein